MLEANRLVNLDEKETRKVFGNIPMFKERLQLLRENGFILLKQYGGKVINILEVGQYEIPKILDLLYELDPWCDAYQGHIFMKRAQLFLATIHGHFQKQSPLKGEDQFTLYADYQIPRALEHLGILKYSNKLEQKINNAELIELGSEEELALRSFTIYAGELLAEKVGCPAAYLDYSLWKSGRQAVKKYHYTRTIWY